MTPAAIAFTQNRRIANNTQTTAATRLKIRSLFNHAFDADEIGIMAGA